MNKVAIHVTARKLADPTSIVPTEYYSVCNQQAAEDDFIIILDFPWSIDYGYVYDNLGCMTFRVEYSTPYI